MLTDQKKDIDWSRVRREFRACETATYFSSAATTLLHSKVYQAYRTHVDLLNEVGAGCLYKGIEDVNLARKKVSELIGSETSADVGFSPNTSHGMNLIAMMLKEQTSKRKIVLPKDEFPSSVIPWYHHGYRVQFVKPDHGKVSNASILDQVDQETAAVVVSAVQFYTGFRHNIIELGRELASREIPFIVNATQILGAFPISVKDAGIKALTSSAHKWLGAGFGSSIFYLSPEFRKMSKWPLAGWRTVEDPSLMSNEDQPLTKDVVGIEGGTIPFACIAGVRAACEVIEEIGIEQIAGRIFSLSNILVKKMKELGVSLITPRDQAESYHESMNSGIVTFQSDRSNEVSEMLEKENVYVSPRRGGVRLSVHYFNDESDIDRLVSCLKKVL